MDFYNVQLSTQIQAAIKWTAKLGHTSRGLDHRLNGEQRGATVSREDDSGLVLPTF